jgi:hypothetical protein
MLYIFFAFKYFLATMPETITCCLLGAVDAE